MSFTFLDIALPLGLGAVFAVFRYMSRLKIDPENALSQSLADGAKGAAGLFIITALFKFVSPS
jgi:hypothetical protein